MADGTLDDIFNDEFMITWRLRDADKHNIAECSRCKKPFNRDIFKMSEPHRDQLLVCRVCFYEITKNPSPELELLFKLIDRKCELLSIVSGVDEQFRSMIEAQRTPARIELDEFQKTAGIVLFGPRPRPEGFTGDQQEEKRHVVFGLDLGGKDGISGIEGTPLIPPTITGDGQ
jgi:hypothetical protein